MTLVQFLIIGLALLVLFRTTISLKRNKITLKLFLFWLVIWGIVIVIAFLPQITDPLSKVLGVGRGVDVAVYFSIILLFFLIYKIMIRLEKIEHEITQLVSRDALKNNK